MIPVSFEFYPPKTDEQREQLHLVNGVTLYGLYEGVPLAQRQGTTKLLPDKITLFKQPLESGAQSEQQLQTQVLHTLWHEVGHYYGLDHRRINELEQKWR